ncbi:MAG TPA: prenyltransferase/squalene oxidase repeat-containing protein [Candidatus Limnocylindria bacterium]|jgi:squalene-hopene/tetraprenyl-beta-curcumene cyclase|nr:prenyltransferase/squalene oxidase repeat-containing protein [Candidatus Limnocylindria bacterium]
MNAASQNPLRQRVAAAHARLSAVLVAELEPNGHWTGELSTSALSTATAVIALNAMDPVRYGALIQGGLSWLSRNANSDGGWGDTIRSLSNLSTSALCWAAFGATGTDGPFRPTVDRARNYLELQAGSLEHLVPTIEGRYGKDRTFSVPIVMTLALSGRLGTDGWKKVHPLPFELAALPREFFGALRLPVVSYALPALIAIGQTIYFHRASLNPLRALARKRTLEVLTGIQPTNGGFLEAVPLTSFVTMSLASMGEARHIVAKKGAQFLANSVRADGSWPIDTNLATWATTLSIKGLRYTPAALSVSQRSRLSDWLLGQQYREIHPYTGAAPGGWAWTDLPGGVPDADDTAGALVALGILRDHDVAANAVTPSRDHAKLRSAVSLGVNWLLGLQNRDGGIPTFCRGWGALPFDQSTPELTAHALRAWMEWLPLLDNRQRNRVKLATAKAVGYLIKSQRSDGTWVPLWFGNEKASHQENPVYGTASVLAALPSHEAAGFPVLSAKLKAAQDWLISAQTAEGGWSGAPGLEPSIEETSLALSALASGSRARSSVEKGTRWLLDRVEKENTLPAAPIGLYFAKLWYYEKLYPLIFATDALGRLANLTGYDK